jgi:twitching motility protein PilT
LLNNTAVENTIRENKLNQIKNVIYTSRDIWMQLLEDDLVRLVEEWKITYQSAIENSNDHTHVQRELQAKGLI